VLLVAQWFAMKTAGIREARQNLSVLLEDVRKGHEVVITDRGKPVARLVPPLPLSAKPFASRAALRRRAKALRTGTSRSAWTRDRPGPLYLGPTVLAKLYRPEPDSDALDSALCGRRDLTVSDLAVSEMLALLAREAPGRPELVWLQQALLEDLESGVFRRAEIVPATHRAAERLLLSAAAVTAGHALHLALAMMAGVAGVLTVDTDLAGSARAVGLPAYP
jgi:prevent-host-death family protein